MTATLPKTTPSLARSGPCVPPWESTEERDLRVQFARAIRNMGEQERWRLRGRLLDLIEELPAQIRALLVWRSGESPQERGLPQRTYYQGLTLGLVWEEMRRLAREREQLTELVACLVAGPSADMPSVFSFLPPIRETGRVMVPAEVLEERRRRLTVTSSSGIAAWQSRTSPSFASSFGEELASPQLGGQDESLRMDPVLAPERERRRASRRAYRARLLELIAELLEDPGWTGLRDRLLRTIDESEMEEADRQNIVRAQKLCGAYHNQSTAWLRETANWLGGLMGVLVELPEVPENMTLRAQ